MAAGGEHKVAAEAYTVPHSFTHTTALAGSPLCFANGTLQLLCPTVATVAERGTDVSGAYPFRGNGKLRLPS